jgi:hypothetical protein
VYGREAMLVAVAPLRLADAASSAAVAPAKIFLQMSSYL